MKEHDLLVTKQNKNKAKRSSNRSKPRAQYPNQYWGIDMTKIKTSSWGWLYLTVVLDWFTKEIVGYSLSIQSKTEDWLSALDMGVNNRFPKGIIDSMVKQLYLVSDNGCQPTSQKFMKAYGTLGIKQIFTTWSNTKGNSDTERVLRTLKEDPVWPYDWDNPFEFQQALTKWIDAYSGPFLPLIPI
jgi:transposase InsO family protein